MTTALATAYDPAAWHDLFVALTPSIARGALAAVILVVAAISGISPVRALRSSGGISAPDGVPKGATVGRFVIAAALAALLGLAGVTLTAGNGGGLDWLPPAFVLAIVIAALNAWVLLVEILR